MSDAVTVKNLVKTYQNGTCALKGVDLTIAPGEFIGLLGANGAGKTTLINILTGLVNKTSGAVKIFDFDLETHFSQAKKTIGVVPQEFNFNMFEKVQDIVVTQAGYFGIELRQAIKDSEDILKKVSLWEKRNLAARVLSGGMKRRLMIARALIHHPKILILDEPTAGVDVELRHEMWEYLRVLNEQGITIILTTHYLEEVEQMCQKAAILKEGEIIHKDYVKNLVKLLDREVYVVTVQEVKDLKAIEEYRPRAVDKNVVEIEIERGQKLNDCILRLIEARWVITDIHPKGRRLEQLFLKILKE